MSPDPARFGVGLRFQMVFTIGLVLVALLSASFLFVLREARDYVVDQQVRNALAISQVFALPVIDALILGDQIRSVAGDLLERQIGTFKEDVSGVQFVAAVDESGRILAHSDPTLYDQRLDDPALLRAIQAVVPVSSVRNTGEGGWMLETMIPLQVGTRRWGSLLVGFDANPIRDEVARLFLILLVLTLLATLVIVGVLNYFVGRFTGALRALVLEVDKIDFETSEPTALVAPNNEIGVLVRHFEQLKARLVHSRNQLQSAQHQVYQAEKLASVGRLAAGVAHEVNNPLSGIRFCLHGIQADPTDLGQTERYLGLIDEGLQQIESVVRKLLGFARHKPTTMQETSLNDEVYRVLALLEFQFREKEIGTQVALDPGLPPVMADPNLIQEMLMNLLLNSVDAVSVGGEIRVRTGEDPDGLLFLSVTDNGVGISSEDMKHIFEPFFSTKETGKGTGLGLSVTQGIVELHKGDVRVESQPGRRTTFTILLPRAEAV
jgi:two-component system, NtrC family, sensor kinase